MIIYKNKNNNKTMTNLNFKIIVKHSNGLEYRSKPITNYSNMKLFTDDLTKGDSYIIHGEDHDYVLMKNFILNSTITIINL